MSTEPERPLFAQVGRSARPAADPKARGLQLLIVIGLLVATGALLNDLVERGRWVTVKVTLEGPELEP